MSDTELAGIIVQLKVVDITKLFFTDLNGRLKTLSVNPQDMGSTPILRTLQKRL